MRIYLFGPMRGYEEFNFPAFLDAAEKLRAAGHEVFSPAEYSLGLGLVPNNAGIHTSETDAGEFNIRKALGADLAYICEQAEAIVGLPGWTSSVGCHAEISAAWAIGIPVYELEHFLWCDTDAPKINWLPGIGPIK